MYILIETVDPLKFIAGMKGGSHSQVSDRGAVVPLVLKLMFS